MLTGRGTIFRMDFKCLQISHDEPLRQPGRVYPLCTCRGLPSRLCVPAFPWTKLVCQSVVLFIQDIIDDTSTLALEKKERVVHGVRRPSHATLSRGECDLEAVVEGGCCIGASCPRDVTETGKYAASSTLWTAGEVGDSDVGREATTVGAVQGDRGGRDRQGEGEYTNVAARQKQGFDPSDEVRILLLKFW